MYVGRPNSVFGTLFAFRLVEQRGSQKEMKQKKINCDLESADKVYERIKIKMVMKIYGLSRSAARERIMGEPAKRMKPREVVPMATRATGMVDNTELAVA